MSKNTGRKVFSFLLIALMVLGLFPFAPAEVSASTTRFIANADEFAAFAEEVNGGNNRTWFNGTFDGADYAIKGLTITEDVEFLGLFGVIGEYLAPLFVLILLSGALWGFVLRPK